MLNIIQSIYYLIGKYIKPILVHIFGAKENDFQTLGNVCDNMCNDPTLYFRKISKHELTFDFTKGIAIRSTRKPLILGVEDGYKSDDSGKHRFLGETQDWILQNTAFQALQCFKVKEKFLNVHFLKDIRVNFA